MLAEGEGKKYLGEIAFLPWEQWNSPEKQAFWSKNLKKKVYVMFDCVLLYKQKGSFFSHVWPFKRTAVEHFILP